MKLAPYDGIFSTRWEQQDYLDSAGRDTEYGSYESLAELYNNLGNEIEASSATASIALNNVPIMLGRYFDDDTTHGLNFPAPVTWSLTGDSFFPSFSHTISSENFTAILGPPASDTLSANVPFDLTYSAPGADSITISMIYFGSGLVYFDNTGWTEVNDFPDLQQKFVPNSGHFQAPPFTFRDANIKSFTPKKVLVAIAWARSDTLRANGKLFGFVTEVVRTREYTLKP